MRGYFSMFRMRLIAGMQYRAAAWAGVATQFFWGFMYIMIYSAFYRSSSAPPPMQFRELSSYIWLQQSFFSLIILYRVDGELMDSITSGYVSYELCRPYRLYFFWYARTMAVRLSDMMMRCLPLLVIASLLPSPYGMSLPPSIPSALLFVASMVLSLILVSSLSMFLYILSFITLNPSGPRQIIGACADFLGGSIIPIPLMPAGVQAFLNFLPFRYFSDLPFRIYSGNIAPADALFGMGIQIAWAGFFIVLGTFSFAAVLRRAVIQGG